MATTTTDRALRALRRKLEAAELIHLRRHAADLAARLEAAEARAGLAEENAGFWQNQALEAFDSASADRGRGAVTIGITRDGTLLVLDQAHAEAPVGCADPAPVERSFMMRRGLARQVFDLAADAGPVLSTEDAFPDGAGMDAPDMLPAGSTWCIEEIRGGLVAPRLCCRETGL